MRTDINQRILNAFDNRNGVAATARVHIGRTRGFTRAFDAGYAAPAAQAAGIPAIPLPQDARLVGGQMWTLYASGGHLWLARPFERPVQITYGGEPLACSAYCRPALGVRNDGDLTLFYTSPATARYRAFVDADLYRAGIAECVTGVELIHDLGKHASFHAIDADTAIALFVDRGGVGVGKIDRNRNWSAWAGRFMFPGHNCAESDLDDRAGLNFSAAARLGNEIIVYCSAPDGGVVGVILNETTGAWSDAFEAIPADLSRFALANAFTYAGQVWLAGQFQRVDDEARFTSTYVYNLLLPSGDGRTFGLDRSAVFTGGDTDESGCPALRWMAGVADIPDPRYETDGVTLLCADANRWLAAPAHFGLTQRLTDLTVEPITAARGDLDGSITIDLPNQDGRYYDQVYPGDALDLEVGALTSENTYEWFRLMRCVVTAVSESYADAALRLSLACQPLTLGRLEQMTHPFTLTIPGRETLRDDLVDFENFERAADEGWVVFPLAVDFWDGQDKAKDMDNEGPGQQTEVVTGDLKSSLDLVEYPVIETLPFEIHLYGWSRSGKKTPNDGTTGGDIPTNPGAPNDRVFCRLYVSRSGGEPEPVDVTTLQTGSVDHYPQTWLAAEAGSYPIVLLAGAADGLAEGDEIQKVGMVFANDRPGASETVFYAERVEMPTVTMKVDSFDETWAEVRPPVVDRTVVVLGANGVPYYTDNFDEEKPTWHEFRAGLGLTTLKSLTYDRKRDCYYAAGADYALWRAEGLGGTWALAWAAETAVAKILALGWTFGGRTPDAAEHGSEYRSIYCTSDGTVFVFGGETPGFNYTDMALFRSTDGLVSLEPCTKLTDTVDGTYAVGQIREIAPGRIALTFMARSGLFYGEVFEISNDNGSTLEYADWDTYGANRGKFPGLIAKDIDHVLTWPVPPSRSISVLDYGETSPLVDYTDALPAATPTLGADPSNSQQLSYAKDSARIMAVLNDKKAYLNEGQPGAVEDWVARYTFAQNMYCVAPSAVYDAGWIVGGDNFSLFYSLDDGATWIEKVDAAPSSTAIHAIISVQNGPPSDPEENDPGQELLRVGIPVLYFAQKPYFAINAEVAAKYYLNGPDAWGGVCLLASDGMNYVAARASLDEVQLIRVRGGLATVVASTTIRPFPEQSGWIRLRHVDGNFQVYVKDRNTKAWSAPLIDYDWVETGGALLTDPLVSHVGIYALLDAPYVRICGLNPDISPDTGVLPGAHLWEQFPNAGVVRIEDARYAYSQKVSAARVLGPYQGRNVGGPFKYSNDGASYRGNAAEFTRFEWLDNNDHQDDFAGEYFATDGGTVWEISEVDFKPFVTTDDVQTFLKNRGRYFSPQANADVIGQDVAVWITHALLGLQQAAGEQVTHGKGSIAYLVNESAVRIYEFAAASGYDDLTDRDAIDRIARIANGTARFPGDVTVASKTLSTAAWRIA